MGKDRRFVGYRTVMVRASTPSGTGWPPTRSMLQHNFSDGLVRRPPRTSLDIALPREPAAQRAVVSKASGFARQLSDLRPKVRTPMPNAPVGPPDASRTPRHSGIANATDRESLIEQYSTDCIPSSERHGTLWHQHRSAF